MEIDWQDRAHFFAVAAGSMRRILVDHAKAKRRVKRGGDRIRIELNDALAVTPEPTIDLVTLDAALQRLSEVDPRKGRVVELHYFGGLTFDETAVALEVSRATVKRDLRLARAWLYAELTDGRSDAS
jgi:RNA polymerase sigma factor (TIGR02999 family)